MPESLPYGVALVLIGLVLADERALDRVPRLRAEAQEVVTAPQTAQRPKLEARGLTIRYGARRVLGPTSTSTSPSTRSSASSAPPASGKTSFLRAINRMDEMTPSMRVDGRAALRRPRRQALAQRLRAARQDRRRLPAAGRPAALDLRQRGAGAAPARRAQEGRPRPHRRALPAPRRAVGRGEGPTRARSAACSPAASSSASPSRARCRRSPSSCCSTSSRSRSIR